MLGMTLVAAIICLVASSALRFSASMDVFRSLPGVNWPRAGAPPSLTPEEIAQAWKVLPDEPESLQKLRRRYRRWTICQVASAIVAIAIGAALILT